MPTFVPPVVSQVPRVLADSRGVEFALMRYYPPHGEGQNVYVYADGTVTQTAPAHTTAELSSDVAPVTTYYGGHVYTVTSAEAALLNAAGYSTT